MNTFVIMPFHEQLGRLYTKVIKPTLEGEGCVVQRADDFLTQQQILKDIILGIFNADLIVAEVTEPNPNVYYELGVAHGLNRPTILLTKNIEKLPFDLASYRHIKYSEDFEDIETLRTTLKAIVHGYNDGTIEFGNPVSDHLQQIVTGVEKVSADTTMVEAEELSKGLWDHVADAEAALYDVGERTTRMSGLVTALTTKFTIYLQQGQLAMSAKNTALVQRVLQEMAGSLTDFADGINAEVPGLRDTWETVNVGVIEVLSIARITSDEDRKALEAFKDIMENLSTQIKGALNSIQVFASDSLSAIKPLSGKIQHSAEAVEKAVNDLYEVYFVGVAYIARILNLIDQKLSE